MAGPSTETPINHVEGSKNNNTPSSVEEQILNQVTVLKALIKEHGSKEGSPLKAIRIDFGEDEPKENATEPKGREEEDDLSKPYKEVSKSPFTRRII